jgi:hypothetical protein
MLRCSRGGGEFRQPLCLGKDLPKKLYRIFSKRIDRRGCTGALHSAIMRKALASVMSSVSHVPEIGSLSARQGGAI